LLDRLGDSKADAKQLSRLLNGQTVDQRKAVARRLRARVHSGYSAERSVWSFGAFVCSLRRARLAHVHPAELS
jgi:hypothetical protein